MITAILTIAGALVAALAPVLGKWILRRWAKRDDPDQQNLERKAAADAAIAKADDRLVTAQLDDMLRRLRINEGRGSAGGSERQVAPGGPDSPGNQ